MEDNQLALAKCLLLRMSEFFGPCEDKTLKDIVVEEEMLMISNTSSNNIICYQYGVLGIGAPEKRCIRVKFLSRIFNT